MLANDQRDSLEQGFANEDITVAAGESSVERCRKVQEKKEEEKEDEKSWDMLKQSLDVATASNE
jgi:hypothetical protein